MYFPFSQTSASSGSTSVFTRPKRPAQEPEILADGQGQADRGLGGAGDLDGRGGRRLVVHRQGIVAHAQGQRPLLDPGHVGDAGARGARAGAGADHHLDTRQPRVLAGVQLAVLVLVVEDRHRDRVRLGRWGRARALGVAFPATLLTFGRAARRTGRLVWRRITRLMGFLVDFLAARFVARFA